MTVRYEGSQVVIAVDGELDMLTAPDLGAVLDSVIDQGHTTVVLDLGDLVFIDCSGLRVIIATSSRLRPVAGGLVLRSTSPWNRQILDITNVCDLVRFERPAPASATLSPEQHGGDASGMVSNRAGDARGMSHSDRIRLPGVGARDDHAVDAALAVVVARARATVGGADGVSVTLSRRGRIGTVASSDETIAQMDRDQYATGEGPCLAAAAEGRWFHVESLTEESRWPTFMAKAVEGGIGSILSTPLLVGPRPVGALNIYSRAERAFGPAEQELAALFATQASGVLTDIGAETPAKHDGRRLADALRSGVVAAQAQGMILERQGVSAEQASAKLRRSADQAGTPMRRSTIDTEASARQGVTQDPKPRRDPDTPGLEAPGRVVVGPDRYPDWDEIYRDNVARMYRLMFAKVGNRPDAEDLTSEVFTAALGPLRIEASRGEVRAYLLTTARTVLAGHWRRRVGIEVTAIDSADELSWSGDPVPPGDSVAAARARHILGGLPDRYRRILELRFLHAMSIKEAAQAMDVTVGNAKVLQHRALRLAGKSPADDR